MAKKATSTKKAVKKTTKTAPKTKKKVAAKPVAKTATKKKTVKTVKPKTVTKPVKKAAPQKVKTVAAKVKTKQRKETKKVMPKTRLTVSKQKKTSRKRKEEDEIIIELPKKPAHKIKGYSKQDLEHFKKIILEKRDEILDQLQNLRDQMMDPTTGLYINENSPYSLHMAEQGTDAMEREKTFLYAQRENKFLGYLEEALKRIDIGTYGICVECIEEPQYLCETCPLIPKARLEAVPHSQLCMPIKQRQEKIKNL